MLLLFAFSAFPSQTQTLSILFPALFLFFVRVGIYSFFFFFVLFLSELFSSSYSLVLVLFLLVFLPLSPSCFISLSLLFFCCLSIFVDSALVSFPLPSPAPPLFFPSLSVCTLQKTPLCPPPFHFTSFLFLFPSLPRLLQRYPCALSLSLFTIPPRLERRKR